MTINNSTIPLFTKLQLETYSYCNRSCWFCPRTYDRSDVYLDQKGKPVHKKMPTDKVLDILDQAKAMGFQNFVSFYFYSEPLADKRNILLAQEARNRGMKPYMHTNGDYLRDNNKLRDAVQEVYEYVVIGIYDYASTEDLEKEKSFWTKKLPSIEVKFSTIGTEGKIVAPSMGIPRATVPSDSRFSIPDFSYKNAPCEQPLIRMVIRYDGEMMNCCEDVHGDFGLGNIHDQTLEELWYSAKHQEIISQLYYGNREKYELCKRCPLLPAGPARNGKEIAFVPRNMIVP